MRKQYTSKIVHIEVHRKMQNQVEMNIKWTDYYGTNGHKV